MNCKAKWWGVEIKDFSEQGIKEAINAVPEDCWKGKIGSYRVSKEIVDLIIVPVCNMVRLPFRVAGFLTRPMIWAIAGLYKLLTRK